MTTMQKFGGAAAYIAAGTFVFGFLLALTILNGYVTATDPGVAVAQLVDHQPMLTLWNLVITILFGVVMVPLAIALCDRTVGARGAGLGRIAAAFGLMWATVVIAAGMVVGVGMTTIATLTETDAAAAESLWLVVDTIGNGLGGGNEVIGAVWVILVCMSAWMARALPRWISAIGILSGLAGLATIVPGLSDAGAVFGLAMIVWFSLVGIVLWYFRPAQERPESAAAPVTASIRA